MCGRQLGGWHLDQRLKVTFAVSWPRQLCILQLLGVDYTGIPCDEVDGST